MEKFDTGIIPRDSILHDWIIAHRITETPTSFQVAIGASLIGALLQRNTWFGQVDFDVFPCLPVILIGPSGIGKDTAINQGLGVLEEVAPALIIGGRTSESLEAQLLERGDPAVGVLPAKELADFLGGKDYQKGIMQSMTDMMSCPRFKDITLKGDRGQVRIMRPTLTVWAGSTKEWLHKAMPEGCMEGGFLPRFLILLEDQVERHIPLIAFDNSWGEVIEAQVAKRRFVETLPKILRLFSTPTNYGITFEARKAHAHWYRHRAETFPDSVQAYAHRSRDHCLRLMMISAASRVRNFIDLPDVEFAVRFLGHVAERVEQVVRPPSLDNLITDEIIRLAPRHETTEIFRILRSRFPIRMVKQVFDTLIQTRQIKAGPKGGWEVVNESKAASS